MGTREPVKKPQGNIPAGCVNGTFAEEYRSDGSIERHEARLEAKGFTQTYGAIYLKRFGVFYPWMPTQNAKLYGDLAEEVHTELPPGFDTEGSGRACKLEKSLYSLV